MFYSNENKFIRARIRCSSKGYCFAVRDDNFEDIYIREQNLNNAWHGDVVFVSITREGQRRRSPEGVVQCILSRNNRYMLAKLESNDTQKSLSAIPLDDRILAKIDLDDSSVEHYNDNDRENNIVEINKINKNRNTIFKINNRLI